MADANTIQQFLASPSSYTLLNVNGKITDTDLIKLCAALKVNTTLISLYLQFKEIGDAGAAAIAQALVGNETLTQLYLYYNRIGDAGAAAIAQALVGNTTLTQLYLHNNQIGDAGAAAIGEALVGNETLTQLNLANNQIGDAGAAAIGEALVSNKTLTTLNLANNQIGDAGVETLTSLKIQHFSISGQRSVVKLEKVEEIKEEIIDADIEEEAEDKLDKLSNIFVVKDLANIDVSEETLRVNELIREGNDRLQEGSQKGILLLGRTGAGKSTLAHLLIGRGLQAIEDEQTGTLVIDAMRPLQDIIISNNMTSETKIPNKCQLGDLVIWDCPGFRDTDVVQEIANAFYIKKLCETNKQLKIVLTITQSDIYSNRGTGFVGVVGQMVESFNNIGALKYSVSLVVTQVDNNKKTHHIQNAINKLIDQNKNIEPSTLQMIEYLRKSVQLFHAPVDEGEVVAKTDILAAINASTEYCDSSEIIANMAVSKKAKDYSENLLQMSSHNFNKILEVIVSAIAKPNDHFDGNDENNIFMQKQDLIKTLVPVSMHYKPLRERTLGDYFRELDQTKALLDIFRSQQNHITSFEDGLDILTKVLQTFEKFVIHSADGQYKNLLQEYGYILSQQFEYIKFFSEICQRELPSIEGLREVINQCQKMLDSNLEHQIKTLELQDEIPDPEYYEKAIKYLDMYADNTACKINKAKAYVHLGNIAKEADDVEQALDYYSEAIKCNAEIPEIYNKLGALFYDQGNYHQAIECFKVTNNTFEIKVCFKDWIATDVRSPTIRMEKGDYYASIGSYAKAKESYHNAFSLSNDEGVKSQALVNIANILNQPNLAGHFMNMASERDYYNFDMVTDEFLDLIGSIFGESAGEQKTLELMVLNEIIAMFEDGQDNQEIDAFIKNHYPDNWPKQITQWYNGQINSVDNHISLDHHNYDSEYCTMGDTQFAGDNDSI